MYFYGATAKKVTLWQPFAYEEILSPMLKQFISMI